MRCCNSNNLINRILREYSNIWPTVVLERSYRLYRLCLWLSFSITIVLKYTIRLRKRNRLFLRIRRSRMIVRFHRMVVVIAINILNRVSLTMMRSSQGRWMSNLSRVTNQRRSRNKKLLDRQKYFWTESIRSLIGRIFQCCLWQILSLRLRRLGKSI